MTRTVRNARDVGVKMRGNGIVNSEHIMRNKILVVMVNVKLTAKQFLCLLYRVAPHHKTHVTLTSNFGHKLLKDRYPPIYTRVLTAMQHKV